MYYYKAINDIYVKTNVELIEAKEVSKDEYESQIAMWGQDNFWNIKFLIYCLEKRLTDTDYKAIKYAEGELTEDEYEPVKEQRRQYRREINELKAEIK